MPLFNNPFATLMDRRDALPSGPVPSAILPASTMAPGPARAVVRMERKGRGGKEVTLVEGLGLGEQELARWLGDLKRSLGCGGAVEGATLVIQGDQRERLPGILEKRGVRKVVVG